MMKSFLYCFIALFINIAFVKAQDSSNFNLFSSDGDWGQSVANYGKYIISVKDQLSSALLYDLEENKRVYRIFLTPHEEKNGTTLIYHCNQCNFGREKYDEQDMFPLLYINQRNPSDSIGALITVYRIIPKLDENDSIVSFSMDHIQNIYLPLMTDENCLGNPNMVIDTKKTVMPNPKGGKEAFIFVEDASLLFCFFLSNTLLIPAFPNIFNFFLFFI